MDHPRRHARLTALAAVVAATATLLVGAPAAHADDVHRDVRGDLQRVSRVSFPTDHTSVDDRQADITRIRTGYTADHVVVTIDLADLRGNGWFVDARVVTSRGADWRAGYSTVSAAPRAYLERFDPIGEGRAAAEQRGSCFEPSVDVDPRADRVVLRISRDCLDDPAWVRTGALAGRRMGTRVFRVDDARRRGHADADPQAVRLGPETFLS